MRKYLAWSLGLACLIFAFTAWVTDFVTLQGEWTVYTASCAGGRWEAAHCGGTLVPSARYRFRALRVHREVLFWTSGGSGPSGRFSDCDVNDGRTWSCPPQPGGPRSIARRMVNGIPVADADSLDVHRIPKWKWELLSLFHRSA